MVEIKFKCDNCVKEEIVITNDVYQDILDVMPIGWVTVTSKNTFNILCSEYCVRSENG
jgi:hypothetical protein